MTHSFSRTRWHASVALAAIASAAAALLLTSGSAVGSPSASQYQYGAPAPITNPVVTGTLQVGRELTVTTGTWSSTTPLSFTYRWGRCGSQGLVCTQIAGAQSNKYLLVAADQGHRIRPYVWATNSSGQTKAEVDATPLIAPPIVTVTGGNRMIAAANVTLPNRLVVNSVTYSQNPIRSRLQATQMRVHVSDRNGVSVQNALVYTIGIPYNRIQNLSEVRTDSTGWATLNLVPAADFPRTGFLVLFVRARVEGQDVLGGTSTRRLVQVTIQAPNGN